MYDKSLITTDTYPCSKKNTDDDVLEYIRNLFCIINVKNILDENVDDITEDNLSGLFLEEDDERFQVRKNVNVYSMNNIEKEIELYEATLLSKQRDKMIYPNYYILDGRKKKNIMNLFKRLNETFNYNLHLSLDYNVFVEKCLIYNGILLKKMI